MVPDPADQRPEIARRADDFPDPEGPVMSRLSVGRRERFKLRRRVRVQLGVRMVICSRDRMALDALEPTGVEFGMVCWMAIW